MFWHHKLPIFTLIVSLVFVVHFVSNWFISWLLVTVLHCIIFTVIECLQPLIAITGFHVVWHTVSVVIFTLTWFSQLPLFVFLWAFVTDLCVISGQHKTFTSSRHVFLRHVCLIPPPSIVSLPVLITKLITSSRPALALGSTAPLIHLLISTLYILCACVRRLPTYPFFFTFFLTNLFLWE